MIASGNAQICTQAFGEPGDPPILLIMGQMASMLWWPESFCRQLVDRGRFVVRYDNRDTGLSTSYPPGSPPYGVDDLADDAVAVLDGYGLERAHLVGMSMGGVIAQLVAFGHPDRVTSLTAISTTKAGAPDPNLPGPSAEYMAHAAAFEDLDWKDAGALAELLVRDARHVAGRRHGFDEIAARDLVARDIARARNPASLMNHGMLGGGKQRSTPPAGFDVPTLVIHGSADPIFPHEHAVALATALPGATLLTVEDGGHELHEADWDLILDAIAAQTATT